jgi:uncharacterized protein YecT (DUF1311 family)
MEERRRSLLILLFLCCGALADDGVNFAGSWDAPVNDVSAFSLDLTQTGNRITGYHTAIAQRGKRIDSVLPDEGRPSITGTITGGVAHVRFQSGYDESGRGEAVLTLRGNKLEWKIIKSSGIHYLPTKSILQRQKNNRTTGQTTAQEKLSADASFRDADRQLNEVYNALRARLSPSERDSLKKEQLAWIDRRDAAAQAAKGNAQENPTDAADREVTKMTLARTAELEKRLKKAK